MTPTLDIAVFSYNRPDYLGDCVASVLRHAPDARLRVYDDGSDDPQTLALLDSLGDRAVHRDPGDSSRHGGLYGNMQFALDQAEGDWLMFLQDDMQIVRDITATEMTDMAAIWDAHPRAAFLCPIFWKQARLFRFRREVEFRASPDRFVTPEGRLPANRKTTLSYFDVAIGHVDRLRSANWQFLNGEAENREQARDLFGPMPAMPHPLTFFAPEVPFFRHRKQNTLATRIAHKRGQGKPRGFTPMTADEVAALKSRAPGSYPIAEDWLTPADPSVRRPFVYRDVKSRRWLDLLHRAETLFGTSN